MTVREVHAVVGGTWPGTDQPTMTSAPDEYPPTPGAPVPLRPTTTRGADAPRRGKGRRTFTVTGGPADGATVELEPEQGQRTVQLALLVDPGDDLHPGLPGMEDDPVWVIIAHDLEGTSLRHPTAPADQPRRRSARS